MPLCIHFRYFKHFIFLILAKTFFLLLERWEDLSWMEPHNLLLFYFPFTKILNILHVIVQDKISGFLCRFENQRWPPWQYIVLTYHHIGKWGKNFLKNFINKKYFQAEHKILHHVKNINSIFFCWKFYRKTWLLYCFIC